MRPYIRMLWNKIRISIHGHKCSSCKMEGIQLFGWDTRMVFQRNSKVLFSDRIISDGRMTIVVGENAELSIGKQVYFNERAMISCQKRIEIGEGCRFGPNVIVIDNNHRFDAENGVNGGLSSSPITIGKNCWIGANSVVLKGTVIGDNCVIAAGSTVKGIIPKGSLVTQNKELTVKPIE